MLCKKCGKLIENITKLGTNIDNNQFSRDPIISASIATLTNFDFCDECQKQYKNDIKTLSRRINKSPNDAKLYAERGFAYYAIKEFGKSIDDYNKAIELDNTKAEFYCLRGLTKSADSRNLHSHSNGIVDLDKAIEIEPNNPKIYYYRGIHACKISHSFQDAASDFNKAFELGLDKITGEFYCLCGFVEWMDRKEKKAYLDLDKAISLNFVNAAVYYGRGLANIFSIRKFETAIDDFNKALDLGLNKKFDKFYLYRGVAKYHCGRYIEAIEDFTRAINIDPNNEFFFSWRGRAKYYHQQYDEAIEDFSKVIALNESGFYSTGYENRMKPDGEDYYWRGLSEYELKKHEEALEDLNKAISFNDKEAKFYNLRGLIQQELNLYKDLFPDYNKAIELEPNESTYYYNRAQAKISQNLNKEAIEDLDAAIKLAPDNVNYYFSRGKNKNTLKLYDEAIKDYTKAIEIEPKNYMLYHYLGIAKFKLNLFEDALKAFNTVIELYSGFPKGYYNRGLSEFELNLFEEAVKDFDKAIQLTPDEPIFYYWRGHANYKLQQYNEVISDYIKSLELNLDDKELIENIKKDIEEIIDIIENKIETNPNYINFYYQLGTARLYLQDYHRTIWAYRDAISIQPNNAITYIKTALSFITMQEKNIKFEICRSDKRLFCTKYSLLNKERTNESKNRKERNKIGIEISNEIDNELDSLDLDSYKKFIRGIFNNAINIDNNCIEAYLQRALYCEKNTDEFDIKDVIFDYSTVISLCQQAKKMTKEIKKQVSKAYRHRGKIFFEKNQYKKAVADYEEYLKINPNDLEVRYDKNFAEILAK